MMPAEAPQPPLGAGSNAHPPGHRLTLLSCLRPVCDEVKMPQTHQVWGSLPHLGRAVAARALLARPPGAGAAREPWPR